MPSHNINLTPRQKSIMGGAAINVKKLLRQRGGTKSLKGGGGGIRYMVLMYFTAITAVCFASKYGDIPNIETVVKYFFTDLLEQGELYKPEFLRTVIETIYVTYVHLGEGQERPLACQDYRDAGYISGEYPARAGENCSANVDAFGENITVFCFTAFVTTLLGAGITIDMFMSSNGVKTADEKAKDFPKSSENDDMIKMLTRQIERKDTQISKQSEQIDRKDTQISKQSKQIDELIEQINGLRNLFKKAFAEGSPMQQFVDSITQRIHTSGNLGPNASVDDLFAALQDINEDLYRSYVPLYNPFQEVSYLFSNRGLESRSAEQGPDGVLQLETEPDPQPEYGGGNKNTRSRKKRGNKRKHTRRYRKKHRQ